jgi:hypothetical protein
VSADDYLSTLGFEIKKKKSCNNFNFYKKFEN